MSLDLERRQKLEIEFWRDAPGESPQADSLSNLNNKIGDADVLLACLARHRDRVAARGRVLELGAGQGWAACFYKRLFPDAHVTATDISEFAVQSLPKWERLLQVKIDAAYACRSYETREADASLDQVFCFASAHHFVAHRRTLREIARVLKPGATAFYFYEPATPRWLYPAARWRVNRKRPQVPEDVLITAELRRLAVESGLALEVDYFPSLHKRARLERTYYLLLGRLPFLQRMVPATANFVFTKPP